MDSSCTTRWTHAHRHTYTRLTQTITRSAGWRRTQDSHSPWRLSTLLAQETRSTVLPTHTPSQVHTHTHTHRDFTRRPDELYHLNPPLYPPAVPGVPRFLSVSEATATSVTLQWAPPLSAPGMLTEYRITVQLLSPDCQSDTPLAEATPLPEPTAALAPGCVHQDVCLPGYLCCCVVHTVCLHE